MTSDLSTIINKYGHEKVFDTIENTLITTAQNLEGYLVNILRMYEKGIQIFHIETLY